MNRIGDRQASVDLINEIGWNITYYFADDVWTLKSGDKILLTTKNEEVLVSMLYGMSLAYSIVPEYVVDLLKDEFGVDESQDDS
jgi:hypothetical protein